MSPSALFVVLAITLAIP